VAHALFACRVEILLDTCSWDDRLSAAAELHVLRFDAALPAPDFIEGAVTPGDVRRARESQGFRGAINPSRRAFEFHENTNRSFVERDVSGFLIPREFRPVFFVPARYGKTKGRKNGEAGFKIVDTELEFLATLVATRQSGTFESAGEDLSRRAHPQEPVTFAKGVPAVIEDQILFEYPRLDYRKPVKAEQRSGFGDARFAAAINTKFDLGFDRRLHAIRIADR
jgi:hypothetical protein